MRRFDYIVVAAVALLILAGLATIYSIGLSSGESLLQRQLLFLVLGVGLFLLAAFLDYRLIAAQAKYFYLVATIILVVVLFFGTDIRGSRRWFEIGSFNLQPSEFVKVALILMLARFFAKKRGEVKSFSVLFHSAILAALPAVIIILQPDLGSALIVFGLWFFMLLLTPVRKVHVGIVIALLLCVAVAGWSSFLHDYQKERVITFLNPEVDPQGSGYNVRQAIIAVGSGQFWGRGLGRGFQSHLRFLPERHTDFIFASFAEELGFVGSALLVSTFGLLIWRLIVIGKRASDSIGLYIVFGTAILLIAQFAINVGMNLGLMPVTGIPLPLVSYGGSSLLSTLFLLGLTQNVYRRSQSGV